MLFAFRAIVLRKYEVEYRQCKECGLLQTEEPYWLGEAHSEAIAVADTGLIMRNLSISARLASLLYMKFNARGSYLDVAGGYGVLTRLMRDIGFDYYWIDEYCKNLMARGFEANKAKKPFTALTAFEVIEHIYDPIAFIRNQMDDYRCRTMIFTTELYGSLPPSREWWYYSFGTGQHISFYNSKTIAKIAERIDLNFYSLHGLHILTDNELKIDPFLYLATSRLAPIFAFLIRRKLGSLTLTDHDKFLGSSET
jgi:hypothetical protein